MLEWAAEISTREFVRHLFSGAERFQTVDSSIDG